MKNIAVLKGLVSALSTTKKCGSRVMRRSSLPRVRNPTDVYFITASQSKFREYASTDKENFIASAALIDFAINNGLYDPSSEAFDYHKAYQRNVLIDTIYNYPYVFELQKMLAPQIKNDIQANTFPIYAIPAEPITLSTLASCLPFLL